MTRTPPTARPARRRARATVTAVLAAGLAGTGLVTASPNATATDADAPAPAPAPATAAQADTLAAAAEQSGRYFGTATDPGLFGDPDYASVMNAEFNSLVAENAMKWDATEPSPGEFSFAAGDAIVAHAEEQGMEVRGHTLVWHAQQPGWVEDLTGDDLRQAMLHHVTETAGHFAGQIASWDVVNEAFEWDGSRRQSNLQVELGDGWIEEAFVAADAADPDARLCYNDYGTDGINAKTDGIYAMVEDFLARGVPIDCVGFQSHLDENSDLSTYEENLRRFADLGVDVEITELDVGGSGAAQADVYRTVTASCLAVERCTGITTWGFTDRHSWRADETPLLFDADYQKKEAYTAVLDALNAASASGDGAGADGDAEPREPATRRDGPAQDQVA